MKILEIITKSNWGGAGKHVFDVSTSMKKKGYQVTVSLGGNGILKDRLEKEGIPTRSIDTMGRDISIGKDTLSFWKIFSIIRSEKPDILHLHSPKAAGIGSFAGRLLGVKKIVQTVHGWTFNEDRPIQQKILIGFSSWITTVFCHKTILINEHDYSQAMYLPFCRRKITLIPIGIEMPIFMSVDGIKQLLAKKVMLELSLFKKKIIIGVIAELHKNKGLEYLIEAMETVSKKHKNAIVIIMGEGELRTSLEERIKKSELEKVVYLVGFVDQAKEYMKGFDLFVQPSIKEGLPYTILEAGTASLPIISTTVGGIPDVIEDMRTGILVQPKNSRELAHAISFMLEHPKDIKKYGKNLKELVITKFSIDKMITSLDSLFLS